MLAYQQSDDEPLTCTFLTTGKAKHKQSWYLCQTCAPERVGCCESCSLCCHFGHKLVEDESAFLLPSYENIIVLEYSFVSDFDDFDCRDCGFDCNFALSDQRSPRVPQKKKL